MSAAEQFNELSQTVRLLGNATLNQAHVEQCTDLLESLLDIFFGGNTVDNAEPNNTTISGSKEQIATMKQEQQRRILLTKKITTKQISFFIQTLDSAQRMFRAKKRTTSTKRNNDELPWNDLLQMTKRLGREMVELENVVKEIETDSLVSLSHIEVRHGNVVDGLPETVTIYLDRLKKQNKEIYKNPPALPPPKILIEKDRIMSPPKRNPITKRLKFEPSVKQKEDKDIVAAFHSFQPNLTPEEVLRGGSFGGTYFRPIVSAVTNESYSDPQKVLETSIDFKWIDGLDIKTWITSSTYRESVNKYKKKCGGSLGMWESSGWISDIDPYGWFQWYCRFYMGRRSGDDSRQIKRWLGVAGPKGRFKSQLCNKILVACPKGSAVNNITISPVIRQTLFHWGLIITKDILDEHTKK